MKLLELVKDLATGLIQGAATDWWVEITTEAPRCTYYFGPFESAKEAQVESPGYIEDLEGEGAKGIKVNVKRCNPEVLTITESDDD